ncbi:MAG: hypothetical protein AAGJ82_15430, partial [Bacteroidota bacterium]
MEIGEFITGGSSGSDRFLDTGAGDGGSSGNVGEISITTPSKVFELLEVDLWPSADDGTSRVAGDVMFLGTKPDGTTVSHTFTVPNSGSFAWEEGLSFAGTPFAGTQLTKVAVSLGAGVNYVAIDDFKFAEFDVNQVLVSIDDVSQVEGDAGTTTFTFTITRSDNTTAFDVTAASGTGGAIPATPGVDYVALPSTVISFAANGASTQTVSVTVNGDVSSEFPETFTVNLSNATNGAIIGDGEGIGTIQDDDTTCETFEDEAAADLTAFAEDGFNFTTTGNLQTGFFSPGGGGGAGSDYYLESDLNNAPYAANTNVGTFQLNNPNAGFELLRIDLYLSNDGDVNTSEIDDVQLTGTPEDGSPNVTVNLTTTATGGAWTENIDFAGTAFDGVALTAVQVILQGGSNYVALDNICFEPFDPCGNHTFTAPADLCIDAGVQAGLGGGMPVGGVYSGPGVTDDGNGMTYSFNPMMAGAGVQTITYTEGICPITDEVEVFALPTVTFTAPADLCINAGVQTGLGGGTPPQGTVASDNGAYTGPGVTDDNNGMTYS